MTEFRYLTLRLSHYTVGRSKPRPYDRKTTVRRSIQADSEAPPFRFAL